MRKGDILKDASKVANDNLLLQQNASRCTPQVKAAELLLASCHTQMACTQEW